MYYYTYMITHIWSRTYTYMSISLLSYDYLNCTYMWQVSITLIYVQSYMSIWLIYVQSYTSNTHICGFIYEYITHIWAHIYEYQESYMSAHIWVVSLGCLIYVSSKLSYVCHTYDCTYMFPARLSYVGNIWSYIAVYDWHVYDSVLVYDTHIWVHRHMTLIYESVCPWDV